MMLFFRCVRVENRRSFVCCDLLAMREEKLFENRVGSECTQRKGGARKKQITDDCDQDQAFLSSAPFPDRNDEPESVLEEEGKNR